METPTASLPVPMPAIKPTPQPAVPATALAEQAPRPTSLSAAELASQRGRLPLPLAFGAVAAVIGLALFASATPSALYGVYEARWHFSTPVLTLVYGVYAIGVLTSLLLVGGLSDQVGRRPVLLG